MFKIIRLVGLANSSVSMAIYWYPYVLHWVNFGIELPKCAYTTSIAVGRTAIPPKPPFPNTCWLELLPNTYGGGLSPPGTKD